MAEKPTTTRLKSFVAACCVLAAGIFFLRQFKVSNFAPFLIGCACLAAPFCFKPDWRKLFLVMPAVCAGLFLTDAFVLHHLIAVWARGLYYFVPLEGVEGTLRSPSGRTTAYIVGVHWLDSSYSAYFSSGGLFPRRAKFDSGVDTEVYGRNFTAKWEGSTFTVAKLTYDEKTGQLGGPGSSWEQ